MNDYCFFSFDSFTFEEYWDPQYISSQYCRQGLWCGQMSPKLMTTMEGGLSCALYRFNILWFQTCSNEWTVEGLTKLYSIYFSLSNRRLQVTKHYKLCSLRKYIYCTLYSICRLASGELGPSKLRNMQSDKIGGLEFDSPKHAVFVTFNPFQSNQFKMKIFLYSPSI